MAGIAMGLKCPVCAAEDRADSEYESARSDNKADGAFQAHPRGDVLFGTPLRRGSSAYHPCQVRHRRRFLRAAKNHAVATRRLLGQALGMVFGAADTLSIDSTVSKGSSAPTAPRKRVIWLQNSADHYFVQMLDALNAQGDVEYFGVFLCPPPQGNVLFQVPKLAPYIFLGDPVQHGGVHGYKKLGSAAKDYIKKISFSAAIVGGYDSRFKRWVLRYCKSRAIPTAMFADSNIRAERGRSIKKKLKRFAKRIFLRRIINQVDRVIPCNRCGVAYWRYYGCPANMIARSTYYCAVDVPAALAVKREELFGRYKLDPKAKLIFTAARLVPAKALHLMVEAFTKSGLAANGWVWAVAGDGPLRQNLENLAAERSRCAGTIRFLGAVAPADIPALMAQSEVFVLPSVYEPHGIVVAEAMAVGTPVIASNDCGAARDLVRNGKTGWLFKSGDAAGLLRALSLVGDDLADLRALRSGCEGDFARWYSLYSPVAVVPRFVHGWLREHDG